MSEGRIKERRAHNQVGDFKGGRELMKEKRGMGAVPIQSHSQEENVIKLTLNERQKEWRERYTCRSH